MLRCKEVLVLRGGVEAEVEAKVEADAERKVETREAVWVMDEWWSRGSLWSRWTLVRRWSPYMLCQREGGSTYSAMAAQGKEASPGRGGAA